MPLWRSAHLPRHPSRRPWSAALVAAAVACLAGVACLAAAPVLARSADWGQFQDGPAHLGSVADGPAPPYRVAWTYRVPKGTVSGPVVHADLVLTVGTTAIFAVDLASGRQVWSHDRAGGPIAIPAVGMAKGKPVLVFTDGTKSSDPSVVALTLGNRTELWRTSLKAPSRSGVTVDGGRTFVADDDGNVYAVSLADGSIEWSAKSLGQILAPPAVADGRVFVTARDTQNQRSQVLALDEATGTRVWEFAVPVAGSTGSGPTVLDGSVIVGLADRSVHALSAQDGSEAWSRLALSVFSPATTPAADALGVYAIDVSGGLYRLDPSSGTRLWDHQLNELVVRSSPVVSGGAVLVGLNDGRLVAVDTASGNLVWRSTASPGLIGPVAIAGDTLVASKGGDSAGLVAYVHDPSGVLVDIPSPTELDPGTLFGNFAIAALIVFAVALVPGRLASARVGPPAWEAWEDVEDEDEGPDGGDGGSR